MHEGVDIVALCLEDITGNEEINAKLGSVVKNYIWTKYVRFILNKEKTKKFNKRNFQILTFKYCILHSWLSIDLFV